MKPYINPRPRQSAFTLIEMLVVIAIIALLISIITPAVSSAIERAKAVACQSKMRQLGLGFIGFTVENNGRLPGSYGAWVNRNVPNGGPFVGSEVLRPGAPHSLWLQSSQEIGTISEYLGFGECNAAQHYRCPALPTGQLDSGAGSNGMFDYPMIKVFGGVKLHFIPSRSTLTHDGRTLNLPTPMIVEEDPRRWLNNVHIETGHANIDQLGTWHPRNSGHYVAVDGSVHAYRSATAGQGPTANDWRAGGTRAIGGDEPWGTWRP